MERVLEIDLTDMKIDDARVQRGIKVYLDKLRALPYFDRYQIVRVYTDENGDFTAFESIAYKVSFFSFAHKITDTLNSPFKPIETDISTFYDVVCAL